MQRTSDIIKKKQHQHKYISLTATATRYNILAKSIGKNKEKNKLGHRKPMRWNGTNQI